MDQGFLIRDALPFSVPSDPRVCEAPVMDEGLATIRAFGSIDAGDNGDIAVAIVSDATENGGATLKRFYLEGNNVRLQPRNPAMQPIIVPADQVEVRGKVVKLLRDL